MFSSFVIVLITDNLVIHILVIYLILEYYAGMLLDDVFFSLPFIATLR